MTSHENQQLADPLALDGFGGTCRLAFAGKGDVTFCMWQLVFVFLSQAQFGTT